MPYEGSTHYPQHLVPAEAFGFRTEGTWNWKWGGEFLETYEQIYKCVLPARTVWFAFKSAKGTSKWGCNWSLLLSSNWWEGSPNTFTSGQGTKWWRQGWYYASMGYTKHCWSIRSREMAWCQSTFLVPSFFSMAASKKMVSVQQQPSNIAP